jgi:Amt family ammonium transporter
VRLPDAGVRDEASAEAFGRINDTCGDAADDEVLRQFARALRVAARSTDIIARIGGDEFGVLLVRCGAVRS